MQTAYEPLRPPSKKRAAREGFCLGRPLFAAALLVSLFSLITCIVLWATNDSLVRVYVFDTKLALFVDRNADAGCRNATHPHLSSCPAAIIDHYERALEASSCTDIHPLASSDDGVKWGNVSYARYPLVTDGRDSLVFWGAWFANMKPIAVLFAVFFLSLCFQVWRFWCFQPAENSLEGGELCPYGNQCQFNPQVYNQMTFRQSCAFRPSHGTHFNMWLEYTLTASLQIVVVCLNFQGFSVNELWLVLALHASLTMIGYIVECNLDTLFMPCLHQHRDTMLLGQARATAALARVFVAEALAWLVHVSVWTLVFSKYNQAKAEVDLLRSQAADATCGHGQTIENIPGWVEAILYSQVVFFSLFGGVQLWQIAAFLYKTRAAAQAQARGDRGWEAAWRQGKLRVWQAAAAAYAVLNVVSKMFLAVILIFAAAM